VIFTVAVAGRKATDLTKTVKSVQHHMKKWQQMKENAPDPGEHHYQLQRPEGVRDFYVWVPKSYDGSRAFPIIFAFHGLGDDCQSFGHSVGLLELSETNNFLLVYPCGYPGLIGNAWNAGTCCLNPSTIDDVMLTRLMVQTIQSDFKVNASRIFASGFSNGAMMSEILGCEAADLIAASASVSGIVELLPGNSEGLTKCSQDYVKFNKAVSTVNIHGTFDLVVPWTGDFILGFPTVPDNFAAWAQRNGCKGQPVQTFQKGAYSNQIYQSCNNGTTVEVVQVSGGGHDWPSDSDFDTATFIVEFFESVRNYS